MVSSRVSFKVFRAVALCGAVLSCRGDKKPSLPDSSTVAAPATVPLSAPVASTGWDDAEAGPLILMSMSDNAAQSAIVLPHLTDSTMKLGATASVESTNNVPVDLFSRSGLVGSAILSLSSQGSITEGCTYWPVGQISIVPRSAWRTGLRKGVATGLALDSLEGTSSADSSLWTTELARIASASSEGSDPAFRGLPFAVRKAYRFVVPRKTILIGDVVRKINQEANPREEHLLLVAERDSSADKYAIAFQSRVAGSEDVVRTNEVLAAILFVQTGRPAVILTFEYEDGGRTALLERTGDRQWKITWRSAYAGC